MAQPFQAGAAQHQVQVARRMAVAADAAAVGPDFRVGCVLAQQRFEFAPVAEGATPAGQSSTAWPMILASVPRIRDEVRQQSERCLRGVLSIVVRGVVPVVPVGEPAARRLLEI